MPNTFALITLITESVISSRKIFKSPYLGHYNDTRHYELLILSEDAGYEISIHVNQIHGPGEPEFIVHQNEPVISISFAEFCLRLYVYCDINWRWTRAIGRETVYYMRRAAPHYLSVDGWPQTHFQLNSLSYLTVKQSTLAILHHYSIYLF